MPEIRYIELKSGYQDNGPAWIGKVKLSKSGSTIYFNDMGLIKRVGGGTQGNYCDAETGEEYWVSGVKKDGTDRHWAGTGKIMLDRSILAEYLALTGQKTVDHRRFTLVDIPEAYPIERINAHENRQ